MNPANEGKEFTVEYTVDAAIQGGLQMYTESEFMDMSLTSRIENLKHEMLRLTNWSCCDIALFKHYLYIA